MRLKICGLFRDEDIDYVNEARPDYAGFVFAASPRQVSTVMAQYLRFRLANGIEPVGVFVNAPIKLIADLYKNGTISIAQLHGTEDDGYIKRLKDVTGAENRYAIQVIKAVKIKTTDTKTSPEKYINADYLLLDSGAGSGKTFDWSILRNQKIYKPWFLAGGIDKKNIEKAIALKPFGIDVSSGAETKGVKDRKKILELTSIVTGKSARKPTSLHIISTTHAERHSRKMTLSIEE